MVSERSASVDDVRGTHLPCTTNGEETSSCREGLRIPTVFDVVKSGALEAVEYLVNKCGLGILCEQDDDGYFVAHWACYSGQANLVRYLIDNGVNIDEPSHNDEGVRPVHWACSAGSIAVVDVLYQAGVSLDIADNRGFTPLIIACQHGYSLLVMYLIGKSVRLHYLDANGQSALHWAAFKGYSDLMRLLIYSGFKPHQKNNQGQTALHLGCIGGRLTTVKDLCEKDRMDINLKDSNNDTPLGLAMKNQHDHVVQFLREHINKRKSLLPPFDLWQLVFGPAGNSKGPFLFYLLTVLVWGYPMYVIRCVPVSWEDLYYMHWIFIFTNVCMWVSWVVAHLRDPGFLPQNTEDYHKAIKQIAYFDEWKQKQYHAIGRLCHTCRLVRPLRAKHCKVCNRCVRHFDHHCPYIYNCVGIGNRVWFLAFSLFVSINCSFTVYLAAYCLWVEGFSYLYIAGLLEAIFFCSVGWILTGSTLLYAALNLTTNEMFNYKRYPYLIDATGKFRNPFSRGLWKNLRDFFMCSRIPDVHDLEYELTQV